MMNEGETLGTDRTDHRYHEGVDGNRKYQIQFQLPGRKSHHVRLYTMGQRDEMFGGQMPALGLG